MTAGKWRRTISDLKENITIDGLVGLGRFRTENHAPETGLGGLMYSKGFVECMQIRTAGERGIGERGDQHFGQRGVEILRRIKGDGQGREAMGCVERELGGGVGFWQVEHPGLLHFFPLGGRHRTEEGRKAGKISEVDGVVFASVQ